MRKQTGAYGTEDQSIPAVLVPICSHLTPNHHRQPVTPAPITLMAWDSFLLVLPPRHARHMGSPPHSELGGSREASHSEHWLGEGFLLTPSCNSLTVSGRIFPPPLADLFDYDPTGSFSALRWERAQAWAWVFNNAQWPKSHASIGANTAKQRKPLHPASPKCRHSPGTPKRSQ